MNDAMTQQPIVQPIGFGGTRLLAEGGPFGHGQTLLLVGVGDPPPVGVGDRSSIILRPPAALFTIPGADHLISPKTKALHDLNYSLTR